VLAAQNFIDSYNADRMSAYWSCVQSGGIRGSVCPSLHGCFDKIRVTRRRNQGSIPRRVKKFFSSAQRPQCLRSTILLYNWHRGLFPCGKSGQGLKLTTHLHLVPRSRMVELYFHSSNAFMGWYLIKRRENVTLLQSSSWSSLQGKFIV
jgi:hypothetical protein